MADRGAYMTALAVAFSLAFTGHPAPKLERPRPRCRTRACVERVARKQCSNEHPVPCIRRAALRYRVSFTMLHRKAWCESRMQPWAWNSSGAMGLLQFMPQTWATTPYAEHSPWYAKWNALAAAWAHHVGRGNEWACQ
jgi:hypothetical protein